MAHNMNLFNVSMWDFHGGTPGDIPPPIQRPQRYAQQPLENGRFDEPVMHCSTPGRSSTTENPQSRYASLSFAETLDTLYSLKQGNKTTSSYFNDFAHLVHLAYAKPLDQLPDNQTSQRLLQVFINGLRENIRDIVKSYNCTNVFHARRIACHEELYIAFNDAVKTNRTDDRLHRVEIMTMLHHESAKHFEAKMHHQNLVEIKPLLQSINDRLVKDEAERVSERHSLVTEIREGMKDMRDKLMSDFSAGLEQRFESSLKHTLKEGLTGMLEDVIDDLLEKKLEEKLEMKLESKLESKLEAKLDSKLGSMLEAKLEAKLDSKLDSMLELKLESKLEQKLTEKLHPFTDLQIPGIEDKFEEVQHVLDHNYECTRKTFNALTSMKEVSRHYRNKSPLNLKSLKSELKVLKNWERKEKERERSPAPRERRKRDRDSEREESNITPPVKLPNLISASPRTPAQRFEDSRITPVPPPQSIPNRILPAETRRQSIPTPSVQVSRRPASPVVTDQAKPKGKFVPAKMTLVQEAPLPPPPGIKTAPLRIELPPLPPISVQVSQTPPPPPPPPSAPPRSTPSYPVPMSSAPPPPPPPRSTPPYPASLLAESPVSAQSAQATPSETSSEPYVSPPSSTTTPPPVPPESSNHAMMDPVKTAPTIKPDPAENEPPHQSTRPITYKPCLIKEEPMDDGYEQAQDVSLYATRIRPDPIYSKVYDMFVEQKVPDDFISQTFYTDDDPLEQVGQILGMLDHRIDEARKCLAEKSHRQTQPCWFCTSYDHHSFYCLRVSSIEKRKEILANRPCQHCFKHHEGSCGLLICHFCKNAGEEDKYKLNHHMVICPIHEEYAKNIELRKVFRQSNSLLMERIN
ncbi:unnamed protein product [Caenorhabditis brenneri]